MAKSTAKYEATVAAKALVTIPLHGKNMREALEASGSIDWDDITTSLENRDNDVRDSSFTVVGIEEINSYRHID